MYTLVIIGLIAVFSQICITVSNTRISSPHGVYRNFFATLYYRLYTSCIQALFQEKDEPSKTSLFIEVSFELLNAIFRLRMVQDVTFRVQHKINLIPILSFLNKDHFFNQRCLTVNDCLIAFVNSN